MTRPLDYIAVKPCGCIAAWSSIEVPKEHLAKGLADWIRRGYSIERCTSEEARQRIRACPHDPPKATQEALI